MSARHKLFRNAAILTVAGFISRIFGFLFRIFLSRSFGEESVGLYQMIFPLYILCLSLSTAGLQTANEINAKSINGNIKNFLIIFSSFVWYKGRYYHKAAGYTNPRYIYPDYGFLNQSS